MAALISLITLITVVGIARKSICCLREHYSEKQKLLKGETSVAAECVARTDVCCSTRRYREKSLLSQRVLNRETCYRQEFCSERSLLPPKALKEKTSVAPAAVAGRDFVTAEDLVIERLLLPPKALQGKKYVTIDSDARTRLMPP